MHVKDATEKYLLPVLLALLIAFFLFAVLATVIFIAKKLRGERKNVVRAVVDAHRKYEDFTRSGNTTIPINSYYVTFNCMGGEPIEFSVSVYEYNLLSDGDLGTLVYTGTRYINFTKSKNNGQKGGSHGT